MAGGYSSLAGSGGGYSGIASAVPAAHAHGALGLVTNLANDVKGAVTGFVPGMIHFAEHPIGSTETMGKAMWSTWSPLFHGQFTKFGQGVYDHPLAPLLDIASVFSLGLGTAARIGAGVDALSIPADTLAAEGAAGKLSQVARATLSPHPYYAPGGQLAKDAARLAENADPLKATVPLDKASNMFHAAARLRLPAAKILQDMPAEGDAARMPIVKQMSQVPGRRAVQQVMGKGFDKLPPQMQGFLGRKIYERALYGYMARRAVYAKAARMGVVTAADRLAKMEADAAKAGGHMPTLDHVLVSHQLMEDAHVAPKIRAQLAMNMFLNLADHAPYHAQTVESAAQFLMQHGEHMGVVMKPIDHTNTLLGRVNSRIDHFGQLALKHAAARDPAKIQAEIDYHNQQLADMYANGHIRPPAQTKLKEPTVKQYAEADAAPKLEHVRAIKALEREKVKAVRSQQILDRAHQRIDELHQHKLQLEQRGANHVFERWGMTHESLQGFANNFGRISTRSFKGDKWTAESIASFIHKHGWVKEDGTVPIVPLHDAANLGKELSGGLAFIRSMGKATRWWKTLQVKLSPKTLVNNTLANHVIAMFRHSDPLTAFRALYHAHRLAKGKDFADQILQDAMLRGGNKAWLMQAAGAELHNTFLEGAYQDTSPEALAKVNDAKKAAGRFGRAIRGPMMYGPVSKIADQPVRLGAIYTYVVHEPAVIHLADKLQSAARRDGRQLSRTEALDQAAGRVLKSDPQLRERASNFGRTIAGDYLAQTPGEQAAKDFIPFYLWDRHILKSGTNLTLDTPIRAAIAQQVSQQGTAEAAKYLGNLPEFLQGAIPLQMLGLSGTSKDGRMNAIVGPSLNPFGTLGEFAGAAESLVGKGDLSQASDVLGQINPLLTDSISAATGKDIVTGSSLKGPGGIIPNVAYNLVTGFPQEKIIQAAVEGPRTQTVTASGKVFPKLYSQNELAAISNFLGIPIKQISPSTATYLAKQQNPVHRKRNTGYSGV